MFEIPGSGITEVNVNEPYVRGETEGPQYVRRAVEPSEDEDLQTSIRI